jgi:hypothetical protein
MTCRLVVLLGGEHAIMPSRGESCKFFLGGWVCLGINVHTALECTRVLLCMPNRTKFTLNILMMATLESVAKRLLTMNPRTADWMTTAALALRSPPLFHLRCLTAAGSPAAYAGTAMCCQCGGWLVMPRWRRGGGTRSTYMGAAHIVLFSFITWNSMAAKQGSNVLLRAE